MTTLSAIRSLLKKALVLPVAAVAGLALGSCESIIYEDEGDCSVTYRLSFRFTKNVLDTDAFGSQVSDVSVAVYDKSGNLVLTQTEQRELTPDNNYYMDLSVAPGTYDIIAWCMGRTPIADAVSFSLKGTSAADPISSSAAVLPLNHVGLDISSDHDIKPLYYGMCSDVKVAGTYGTVNLGPVYLTKDTNHIIVQLQNVDGTEIDPAAFTFELEGANSNMDWLNLPTGSPQFTYRPWATSPTYSYFEREDDESRAMEEYVSSGVQVEFTTSRLMANREQYLTVRLASTGERIFRVPLVEFLLLIRSEYDKAVSAQDYLDREDTYTVVFFMQDGLNWMKSKILINGWRRVPPQHENL